MIQEAENFFMQRFMNERDFAVRLAKQDISKAVAIGRVSQADIYFLYELANGDPTNSGLDNQQLIDLTKKKANELFGERAARVFGWGDMEVWSHMSSEYKRQSVNKPKTLG